MTTKKDIVKGAVFSNHGNKIEVTGVSGKFMIARRCDTGKIYTVEVKEFIRQVNSVGTLCYSERIE